MPVPGKIFIFLLIICAAFKKPDPTGEWIRINQLGYSRNSIKVAVWVSKDSLTPSSFQVIDSTTSKPVYTGTGTAFGEYAPFTRTLRLNFTALTAPGKY